VQLYRTVQRNAFTVAPEGFQFDWREAVVDALYYLIDDWAFIQVRCNIMGRRANHLYPSFVRLVIRPRALETGQKRVVDIDGPP